MVTTTILPSLVRSRRRRQAGATPRDRRGAALVELAVCLPLLMFLVLGSIDCCTMIFLKHSLSIAAYEGARVALRPEGTTAAVAARVNSVLSERAVLGGTITTNPTSVETSLAGAPLAVTVSAACDANAIMPSWFFGGKSITATVTMNKE